MREGKHAAKGGTMKVLIALEGLLFTEDRGRFGSVNEHIYIYIYVSYLMSSGWTEVQRKGH